MQQPYVKFMGCTRQVTQHVAFQYSDECRARLIAEVSVYDASMLLWIDESGCNKRNSVRKEAYGIRGITLKTTDSSTEALASQPYQ